MTYCKQLCYEPNKMENGFTLEFITPTHQNLPVYPNVSMKVDGVC